VQRACVTFRIKSGTREEYIKRHNEIWPELVEIMQKYGFKNQSIFINNKHVIAYLECQSNYKEQAEKYAMEKISIKWQEYFNDIIDVSIDGDENNRYTTYEEVWHLD